MNQLGDYCQPKAAIELDKISQAHWAGPLPAQRILHQESSLTDIIVNHENPSKTALTQEQHMIRRAQLTLRQSHCKPCVPDLLQLCLARADKLLSRVKSWHLAYTAATSTWYTKVQL